MQGRKQQQQGTAQVRDRHASFPGHRPEDRAPGPDRSAQEEAARAAPLLLLALLLLAAIWWDGAFDLRYWSPLTLLSLTLLLALTLAGTLALPGRGPLAAAVVAIWAFAAFALLSAAWSESPAAAWEGGARALFYAATFTLAVATPVAIRGRGWIGAGIVLGILAIGLATELTLLAGHTDAFLAGRLDAPIGYRNATAALFCFAVWPLLGFAAQRGSPSGLRAAAFSAATLLAGLAFLTQSRGMLFGLAVGGAVSIAIGPDRLRRAWLAVALVAAIAVGSGGLLSAYDASAAGTGAAGAAEIADAAVALALLCAAAGVAGLFAFVFDNGLRAGRASGRLRQAAALGLASIAVAAAALALARAGDPVGYADRKLDEFTATESTASGRTRLGSVSGPRYDIWRVALVQFDDAPVAGAGEGSYRFAYYRERRTDRNLADAHSLPLRVLAETGLIGAVLFAAWLALLAVAVVRRARAAPPGERRWVGGLAAAGAVVLAQSAVDWLWLIPALFGLALIVLGLAARGGDPSPRPRGWSLRAPAALSLALAAVCVATLFLSGLFVRKARSEAATSPAASLSAARTAARLNPVSVTPLYLEASALETLGRRDESRQALLDALALEPGNFVTLGVLGDLEVRSGNGARARAYYRKALAQNPLDVGLRELSAGERE